MKNLICIVCPKGCHLSVDDENGFAVTGNQCEKGAKYGYDELTNPERMITSTVVIENGIHKRLPVRTDKPISKEKIYDCMNLINDVVVKSPIKTGDIIIKNILETDVNIISSRDM